MHWEHGGRGPSERVGPPVRPAGWTFITSYLVYYILSADGGDLPPGYTRVRVIAGRIFTYVFLANSAIFLGLAAYAATGAPVTRSGYIALAVFGCVQGAAGCLAAWAAERYALLYYRYRR